MALGVAGVRVGTWTSPEAPTGTTAVLPPAESVCGAAVRGAAPGTREVAALGPNGRVSGAQALVLSGGSAFGLAAADGAAAWCGRRGLGHPTPVRPVPVVGAAILFDLTAADQPTPGWQAGHAACEAAADAEPPQGSVGAGAGCSVGKHAGPAWGSASGQGVAAATAGDITAGALVAANPLGDVLGGDGTVLAGSRAPAGLGRYPWDDPGAATTEASGALFGDTAAGGDAAGDDAGGAGDGPATNTVIGCVVTNAQLSKTQACRVADLAHTGVARAVRPAHTSFDGDALFAAATGAAAASTDLVADLAAAAVADAVRAAVRHASSGPVFPADPRARA